MVGLNRAAQDKSYLPGTRSLLVLRKQLLSSGELSDLIVQARGAHPSNPSDQHKDLRSGSPQTSCNPLTALYNIIHCF